MISFLFVAELFWFCHCPFMFIFCSCSAKYFAMFTWMFVSWSSYRVVTIITLISWHWLLWKILWHLDHTRCILCVECSVLSLCWFVNRLDIVNAWNLLLARLTFIFICINQECMHFHFLFGVFNQLITVLIPLHATSNSAWLYLHCCWFFWNWDMMGYLKLYINF